MRSISKKISILIILAIISSVTIVSSFIFFKGQDGIGEPLNIRASVYKEDGLGGWTPIINSSEKIEGNINFECEKLSKSSKIIELLEFYLANSIPDLLNPNPEDWSRIYTFNEDMVNYSAIIDSQTIPDDDWYFIVRAIDKTGVIVYDAYNISNQLISFLIDHFESSVSFNYMDIGGRINQNSYITIIPLIQFEQYIDKLDIYIKLQEAIDLLTEPPINYSEIISNYHLIDLTILSAWINNKSLTPNEYNISFIIELHLDYGEQYSKYIQNYTLEQIVLDIEGPNISLVSEDIFEKIYNDLGDHIITATLNYTDNHFDYVTLEYSYDTHELGKEIWYDYKSYVGNSPLNLNFSIINWKDDKIFIHFTGYDNLGNSYTLSNDSYWIRKDMNNHLDFIIEDLNEDFNYTVDGYGMIDINITVYPYDNDITSVHVVTDYETFILSDIIIKDDYIYFTDYGSSDDDIKLVSALYMIMPGINYIPINIEIYQNALFIISIEMTIKVLG
ncbi:MAG: hypothetical protein ACFE9T_00190 [Promethearchaeota archaeon]